VEVRLTPGDRLNAISSLEERLVLGLSSGTSHDGIDTVLVRIGGHGDSIVLESVGFATVPFGAGLRERIARAGWAAAPEINSLNFDLGEAFAAAALGLLNECGVEPSLVNLIGSHGQTVHHLPPSPGRGGATLQLGEPDVIARRTGIPTVADFRTADVAAGGSGAPLVPLVDWLLFRTPGAPRVLLNIGGIANLTWVTERLEDVVAFDTGPGNALLDEIVRSVTGRVDAIDEEGALARSGAPVEAAVDAFLEHPYFSATPPKSTGKETFGREAADRLAGLVLEGRGLDSVSEDELPDLLATAALVTARSVFDASQRLPGKPARVIVSGGGLSNRAIMDSLEELFAPVPVVGLGEGEGAEGMNPDAKEAVAFAVLADRTVAGLPGNVPAATGAAESVVLGKLSMGT
jgi:anhydro-N-acetylmuramic acid kinase